MLHKQKITPCLWFGGQAEDAANFYVSTFKNSRITAMSRYGDAGPGPKGSVMTVAFELDGQSFTGLNGGPPRSTTTGRSCPPAGRPSNAAGLRTSSECPGRSCQPRS